MLIDVQLELIFNHNNKVSGFYLEVCPCCNRRYMIADCEYPSPIECLDRNGSFSCLGCGSSFLLRRYDYGVEPNATVEILEDCFNILVY